MQLCTEGWYKGTTEGSPRTRAMCLLARFKPDQEETAINVWSKDTDKVLKMRRGLEKGTRSLEREAKA
jgi:hypothetical protein